MYPRDAISANDLEGGDLVIDDICETCGQPIRVLTLNGLCQVCTERRDECEWNVTDPRR